MKLFTTIVLGHALSGQVFSALGAASGALTPYECSRNALAFNFSLALQPFRDASFAYALKDALNASACGSSEFAFVPPGVQYLSQKPLQLTSPVWHRLVDPHCSTPECSLTVASALADLRRWRQAGGGRAAATIELASGLHRVGVGGLRLDPSDGNTTFLGQLDATGSITAWLSGADALPGAVQWKPFNVSGGSNVWVADVGDWLKSLGADSIESLRVAGARQTLARFPNANPELDGFGSSLHADAWLPPATFEPAIQFSPALPFRNVTGNYTRFALGIGGACSVFSPPASLWCSTGRTQSGGSSLFEIPTGLVASRSVLPHTPYADPTTAVVHAFRPSRWESYMFSVNGTAPGNASVMQFGGGGFQGGRGSAACEAFFIERVFEELDSPGEWFFDAKAGLLYLWHNASSGTPPPQAVPGVPGTGVEVPLARVIVNVTGSASTPVLGVSFVGVGFRDTRPTFMDPHSVPSGGDWALQRSGALYLESTIGTTVDACAFWRLDGTALLAYGFHRGLNVSRSEFAWIGETAVALWGETTGANAFGVLTDGPDGTAGLQPVGSIVDLNWFHELGIYEKQAAAVFQAKSSGSTITRNVAFNGPRAGILLNDGFGGGTLVRGNALFNLVRETGPPSDHGPINSWDRQAYEWLDQEGRVTSTKATDVIERNLLIGNYWTSTPGGELCVMCFRGPPMCLVLTLSESRTLSTTRLWLFIRLQWTRTTAHVLSM